MKFKITSVDSHKEFGSPHILSLSLLPSHPAANLFFYLPNIFRYVSYVFTSFLPCCSSQWRPKAAYIGLVLHFILTITL